MAKRTTKTIFVGHKAGTFKAYYGLTSSGKIGWHVAFLDRENNISYPDGDDVYSDRQGAYRRAKQLNDLMDAQKAEAGSQGALAGDAHAERHEDLTQRLQDGNALIKEDPTAASHEYRFELAQEKAREAGFTTPDEIRAYAIGYEEAFVNALLDHKYYRQAYKKYHQ